ncbi:MAG: HD domain-containing protein [Gammaproteobacteria bacterium]|nr:HD domain-containing protein [Gammaproteobacteria bacterium]
MTLEANDLKKLMHALEFASRKHKDQRRKDVDASPYINHPISLANILCNEAGITNIDVICGALLHDTVEDTDTTEQELNREFGEKICSIVMDVTDNPEMNRVERKQAQIDHAAHASTEAKLVKLADKISNLRDVAVNAPPSWSLERRQEYFDWAKQVIDQVRGVHPLLESIFDQAYTNRP